MAYSLLMTNSIDRLDALLAEDNALDQALLDIDPDTDLFWELTAQREAVQATMRILLDSQKAF